MTDAHLHLCDNTDVFGAPNIYFVNATSPEDWYNVVSLASDFVFPFIGIHPWWTQSVAYRPRWLEELAEIVNSHSCGIGEIGLDKITARRNPEFCNMEIQLRVFGAQLELARELHCPVSLHIVRSWDLFFKEICRVFGAEKISMPAMIHGFNGSSELLKRLIRAGFDISFGLKKNIKVFSECPATHRLLESDATGHYDPQAILNNYRQSALLLNISTEHLIKEIFNNAKIYTQYSYYR